MEQSWKMKIDIWGVRGSMPAPSRDFLEYGGHTSCISVDCGETLVVFDAGSGLLELGRRLPPGAKRIDLFFSHLHIDHMLGLFAFAPLHDPAVELHIYGEPRRGAAFARHLSTLVGPPYWPLGLSDFRANIILHEIGPGCQALLPGGTLVRMMRGSHPDLALYFRLESAGRCAVYALDCELDAALRPGLVEFARNADVLVWDANFTAEDLARCPGWGHSTWEQGAALRRDAGAKLALMTHYASDYPDEKLREMERLAALADPAVRFARENMEVCL